MSNSPGFKVAIQEVEGRWYLYIGHFWHRGWTIMDITRPSQPELLKFIPGPANTWTLQVQVAQGKMVTALERVGDGILGRNDIWGYDPSQPFGEGILIWDVKNPTDPKQLGFFKTGGFGTRRNFYAGGEVYLSRRQYERL